MHHLTYVIQGTSGRTLRRLPLLAHARHAARAPVAVDWNKYEGRDENANDLSADESSSELGDEQDSLETWLEAMHEAVTSEQQQMARVEENSVYL